MHGVTRDTVPFWQRVSLPEVSEHAGEHTSVKSHLDIFN